MHRKSKLAIAFTCALFATHPASADGELFIYNWAEYFADNTLDNFSERTGNKVTYDTFDSLQVLETRLLAGGSGYDIVFPSAATAQRAFSAGALQPIDTSRLKNTSNLDPALRAQLSNFPDGDKFGVPYMWGTVAIARNVQKIQEIMPDAPIDSLDMFFDPEIVSKFADCGVTIFESPTEVIPVALNYLGLDPYSTNKEDLDKVAELLAEIRPHMRYIGGSAYMNDLASGGICLALVPSGDALLAGYFAAEAGQEFQVDFAIPKEGTMVFLDVMSIPADAKNLEQAYAFIDYILEPQVIADISNFVFYANANAASKELLIEDVSQNPQIYPSQEIMSRLFGAKVFDARESRAITRTWSNFRSGN